MQTNLWFSIVEIDWIICLSSILAFGKYIKFQFGTLEDSSFSFLQARLSRSKLFRKFPCRLQFRAPAHLNVLFLSPDSFQFHLKLQDLKFHITGFDPELFELEILRTTLRPVFSKVYGGILTTIFSKRDPRPPISDPEVPMGSTRFRKHLLQVWSETNGRITRDRTIGRLSFNANFKLLNRNIRGSDSRSVNSDMILGMHRSTYIEIKSIQRSKHVEPGQRLICDIR
ncbi:hypothetical protein GBA52_024987 [Prunus armeniaca]|nr:hypothetical protein GBA52_024987 [Prunus armeniaca]